MLCEFAGAVHSKWVEGLPLFALDLPYFFHVCPLTLSRFNSPSFQQLVMHNTLVVALGDVWRNIGGGGRCVSKP